MLVVQKGLLLLFEVFELFSLVLICNVPSSPLSEQQTVDLPKSCMVNESTKFSKPEKSCLKNASKRTDLIEENLNLTNYN